MFLFWFGSIFKTGLLLTRQFVRSRLNSMESLYFGLKCGDISFWFPIAFIVRKFFPLYKILLLIVTPVESYKKHYWHSILLQAYGTDVFPLTFSFYLNFRWSEAFKHFGGKMILVCNKQKKVETGPASKDPVNSCPFGSNGNKIIICIITWRRLTMEIVNLLLQTWVCLECFIKFFLRNPDRKSIGR